MISIWFIFSGQIIFAAIYIGNLVVVLLLYARGKSSGWNASAWTMLALMLSKRIHSIYILRMFIDCIAVFLGYIAILQFTHNRVSFNVILHCYIAVFFLFIIIQLKFSGTLYFILQWRTGSVAYSLAGQWNVLFTHLS